MDLSTAEWHQLLKCAVLRSRHIRRLGKTRRQSLPSRKAQKNKNKKNAVGITIGIRTALQNCMQKYLPKRKKVSITYRVLVRHSCTCVPILEQPRALAVLKTFFNVRDI